MKQETFEEDEFLEEGDELSIDEFLSGENKFIKAPAVGESVEFILTGVKRKPAKKVKNPTTGKMMDIKLSGDNVDYYFEFLSTDDKYFEVATWQIIGKTKAIIKKIGKYGFKIKISHVADGRTAPQGTDSWKVYAEIDGSWKELKKVYNKETKEETEEWIDEEK
jgi:hypothetical protein